MARHLIRNAVTGQTLIVGSGGLPFFVNQGYMVLDDYDDELPPFTYPTLGEGDLRYVNVTELADNDSPAMTALRGAFGSVVDAGTDLSAARPTGAIQVLWLFDAGVDVGTNGASITNAQPGDTYFVADA